MGDPSYVEWQDIEIFPDKKEALKAKIAKGKTDSYWERISLNWETSKRTEDTSIEIDLDDVKVIQYWYPEFLAFLEELAPFIHEGTIELDCPGFRERASIVFNEGKVWLELQSNDFQRYELKDLRK